LKIWQSVKEGYHDKAVISFDAAGCAGIVASWSNYLLGC